MQKRKVLSLLIAVVMIIAVLTACSKSAESPTPAPSEEPAESPSQEPEEKPEEEPDEEPATSAEPTEIDFWTFQELHVKFYEKMAEKWNAENPDKPLNLFRPSIRLMTCTTNSNCAAIRRRST